jgi:hypothetical protein
VRFFGPLILSILAETTDDAEERRSALSEGEAILAGGAVSHNYFWFYGDAIDVALRDQDWTAAIRYATSLEAYTSAEPLPWADFVIARGRALAAIGAGRRDSALMAELRRLHGEAQRLDLMVALPALNQAIGAAGA